jgi:hypothetical protein
VTGHGRVIGTREKAWGSLYPNNFVDGSRSCCGTLARNSTTSAMSWARITEGNQRGEMGVENGVEGKLLGASGRAREWGTGAGCGSISQRTRAAVGGRGRL